ncbi:hypothetical protein K1719_003243 [Acacia pycnantha]|nr:hypothetical protein K1719_003243 [Acacia pycnantha]
MMRKQWKVALRIVASVACVGAATWLCFTRQKANFGDRSALVQFRDVNAPFWCFVVANCFAFVYSIAVSSLRTKSLLWKPVVAFDAVLMVILFSSCSAAMAVTYLETYGNFHALWRPICSRVHSYCANAFGAIFLGYVGALFYLLLHLVSIQEGFNALLI